MNEIEQAKQFFREDAMTQAVFLAEAMEAEGTAEWILDPDYDKVVGLVHKGTNRAYVIVYLPGSLVAAGGPGDFECSDEFDEMVYKSARS